MADGSIRIKLELEKHDFERQLKRALELSNGKFGDMGLSDLISSEDANDNIKALQLIEEETQRITDGIAQMKAQGQKPNAFMEDKKDAEELAKIIKNLINERAKLNATDGNGLKVALSGVKKWSMALLGIRTTYALISKGVHAFLSNNQQFQAQLQGIWNALGELLSPAIEYLINLLVKAVGLINAFIKALTGVDIVARANAKSLAKQNNQLASFDEMNKLSSNGGSVGGLQLPELTDGQKAFFKYIEEHAEIIKAILSGLATTIGVLLAFKLVNSLGGVVGVLEKIKGLGGTIFDTLTKLTGGSGLGLAIAIISGLIVAVTQLYNNCEPFRKFVDDLRAKIKTFFTDLWEKMKQLPQETKDKLNGVISFVEGAINKIINGINALIRALNKIKWDVPDWVPVIGGKKLGFNIPSINGVSLPKLATGGIVMRPTQAIIGESGREAVLPLEQNTEWMDRLAEKINSQSSIIYVQLDGKTIAKQINKANNRLSFLTNGG